MDADFEGCPVAAGVRSREGGRSGKDAGVGEEDGLEHTDSIAGVAEKDTRGCSELTERIDGAN